MLASFRYAWIINLLIFQIGWVICVVGGSLWAVFFTVPALAFHSRFYPEGSKDALGIALMLIIRLCHDNLLAASGILVFNDSVFSPLWLWCLWLLLGMTLKHSLAWVYSRPWVAAIGGAVSGPLAYVAGVALSDAQWGVPIMQASVIMAGVWLFILPLHRFLVHKVELLWH